MNAKVGLITFGDHREDMWQKVFGESTMKYHGEIIECLKQLDIDLKFYQDAARTREQINEQADGLIAQGVDILIGHTPCWTSPNLVVQGVQRVGKATVMIGNRDMSTHGCVGLLGACGALSQIGYDHKRMRLDYDAEVFKKKLIPYFTALKVKAELAKSVFGLFGGRSIGIDTATFDPMGWRKQFGIDSEHIDQSEILMRAKKVDPDRIQKMIQWIHTNAKEVIYSEKLTKEKFEFQIGCYLATKDICKEMGLDFIAIKCMPDLSTYAVPQCMTATFMADTYDGEEGQKESIPMACEADADGALTQEILKIISGGTPTFFADVSHIDDDQKIIYCVNCGGICAHYADRSCDACQNLNCMTIKQSIRPGGGAISCFTAKEGPMQLARLYRVDGQYKMAILPCEAVRPTEEMVDAFIKARGIHQLPVLYAKMTCEVEDFINEYGSNHISGVAGEYTDQLVAVCQALGIEPVVFK